MKKYSSVLVLVLAFCVSSVFAQGERGAQALLAKPAPVIQKQSATVAPATAVQTQQVSAVRSPKSRVSYSIKSRGFVGNYEVVTLRERGLWGNGCLTQLLVDPRTGEPVAVLNTSASAGPGIAMIQGASFVGGMYLFAEHLRPNQENVNSGNTGTGTTVNNSNSARGGNAVNSNRNSATGGQGGNASAVNNNRNSNSNSNTSTSSGGDTPPPPPTCGHTNHSGGGDGTNPGGHGNSNGFDNPGQGHGHNP